MLHPSSKSAQKGWNLWPQNSAMRAADPQRHFCVGRVRARYGGTEIVYRGYNRNASRCVRAACEILCLCPFVGRADRAACARPLSHTWPRPLFPAIMDPCFATSGGRTGGNLWVWGTNERGQLGLADTSSAGLGRVDVPVLAHVHWEGWHGLNVSKVAAAHYSGAAGAGEFSVVLTSDGRVFTFGDCTSGNLGTGLRLMAIVALVVIISGMPVIVVAGVYVVCVKDFAARCAKVYVPTRY